MKHNLLTGSTMSFVLILFLAVSCKKESTLPQLPPPPPPPSYSVDMTLSAWTIVNKVYVTTFSMPEGATNVYVLDNGHYAEIGTNPIQYIIGNDYFSGKLWLNVYSSEAVVSFSDDLNVNPGSINIRVIGIK